MFSKEIYRQRRNRLKKLVGGGIVLFMGNGDTAMNYHGNSFRFRQDSNFLYFFGLDRSNIAGIIDIDNDREIIFGNDVDLEDIIWMGPQEAIKDNAALAGVLDVRPLAELSSYLKDAVGRKVSIHYPPPYRNDTKIFLNETLGVPLNELKNHASLDLIKAIVEMRSVKEPCEIEEIEKTMLTAREMFLTAMRLAKDGLYEYEIDGAIEGVIISKHGGAISFPVICSVRGETLHNHHHGNKMKNGDLLLIDAGFESETHYSSDHTRTIPVSGKFTDRQKAIYEIVLKANTTVIDMIKPDLKYLDAHLKAAEIIADGLKGLGLMKGDTKAAVAAGAHALFFPHGVGHMLGLDAHDMEGLGEDFVGYDDEVKRSSQFGTAYLRLGRRLREGFVITVEPGIYFIPALIDLWQKENKFAEFINYDKVNEYRGFGGIRIEDNVLVTNDGHKLLGADIPKTTADIESVMRK